MKFFGLVILAALASTQALASDHLDGPVTSANRVADLTDLYAFPTPGKPGSLSLILNTYPLVGAAGHFTDKVTYTILLRRAVIKGADEKVPVETSDEVSLNCTFKTPAITTDHVVTCKSSNGLIAESKYDVVQDKQPGDDFRLYSGMRSDPFFFSALFATLLGNKGIELPPFMRLFDRNVMNYMNILTIVIEVDVNKLYPSNTPSLLAVTALTTTQDSPNAPVRQIDRVGRPEITNVTMVAHTGDPEIRDKYNLDRPFQVPSENQEVYKARISRNIAFYDMIDKKKDWQDADRDLLATILTDDYELVDISKPCQTPTYFDIEKSILRRKPYESCGGRKPNDNIMDVLFTMYIGGLDGKGVDEGVEHPYRAVSAEFPYLAAPDLSLVSRAKAAAVLKALHLPK